jgi:phage gp29-like protein
MAKRKPVRVSKHVAAPSHPLVKGPGVDAPNPLQAAAAPRITVGANPAANALNRLRGMPGINIRSANGNGFNAGVGDVVDMNDTPVPHIITFSGYSGQLGKVYRNPDEAWRDSRQNARYMRNDLSIMECVEARQRSVALLPWHLETDRPNDPLEKMLTDQLTNVVNLIPRFTEFRRVMQEAIWYGRSGMQMNFGTKIYYGMRYNVPMRNGACEAWEPINGDKLAFRYDDGRVGIRIGFVTPIDDMQQSDRLKFIDADGRKWPGDVNSAPYLYDGNRARKVEVTTEYGRVYFLDEDEMDRVIVHKHMIEDADFENPVAAGRLHGVGIRDRIYWAWFQKQNTMGLLMEYLERSSMGFEIWTYPSGNSAYLEEIQQAAFNRLGAGKNIVFLPVIPGQEEVARMEHIETGLQGIDLVQTVVHQYFEWQIKRYILGQVLSSEPESGGLSASSLSDFQKGTLYDILAYDARNAEETISHWLNTSLKRRNRGVLPLGTESIPVHFKIDTESEQMMEQLEAIQTCFGMGLPIKQDSLYGLVGIDKPGPTDQILGGMMGGMPVGGTAALNPLQAAQANSAGAPGAGPPGLGVPPGAGAPPGSPLPTNGGLGQRPNPFDKSPPIDKE